MTKALAFYCPQGGDSWVEGPNPQARAVWS